MAEHATAAVTGDTLNRILLPSPSAAHARECDAKPAASGAGLYSNVDSGIIDSV
jgi:hypothetical protein